MTGLPKRRLPSSMLPFWIRHECAGVSSCGDLWGRQPSGVQAIAWRLVMVPEARRGERGQEPAALGPGTTARVRAPVRVFLRLIKRGTSLMPPLAVRGYRP